MNYKKKAAAILCSAAAVVMAAASAVTAFAFETVKIEDRKDQIESGKINVIADEVYAASGEQVSYSVYLKENSGYSSIGVRLYYDPQLVPVTISENQAEVTPGDAVTGMGIDHTLNKPLNMIAVAFLSDNNKKTEGTLFTVKFDVPKDAVPGTKYPLTMAIDKLYDSEFNKLEGTTVDGWIQIQAETTTAPAAPTTTVATVVTSATVPKTPDETTLAPKTDAPTVGTTATAATEITTNPDSDVSTVSSTKKTDRDPTKNVTTSGDGKKNDNGKKSGTDTAKTDGVKTGDTGIAVAIAALLLAGSSAVIFGRKKKD